MLRIYHYITLQYIRIAVAQQASRNSAICKLTRFLINSLGQDSAFHILPTIPQTFPHF